MLVWSLLGNPFITGGTKRSPAAPEPFLLKSVPVMCHITGPDKEGQGSASAWGNYQPTKQVHGLVHGGLQAVHRHPTDIQCVCKRGDCTG